MATRGLGLGTTVDPSSPGRRKSKHKHQKLDEGEYVIPGYDGKGRADMVQFRLLPGYSRMASEIIANGKFPFKTIGDLWRFCAAYGLDHLASVEPPKFNIMSFIRQETATIRDQIYMREHAQTIESLDELVKYHAGQDNHMNKLYAKALVEAAVEEAKRITDPTWRRSTLKKLRDRFRHIIEMKVQLPARVTLDPEAQEPEQEQESEQEEEQES